MVTSPPPQPPAPVGLGRRLAASALRSRQTLGLVLGLAAGALLWLWVLSKPEGRAPEAVVSGLGIGLLVAATAMAGDLLSSFLKRRLALAPSSQAIGLDQIPE